jgi:hypothetical protein
VKQEGAKIENRPAPPTNGGRPMIEMLLSWSQNRKKKVRSMCDIGSTVPILNKKFIEELRIPTVKRHKPIEIRNFNDQVVSGAGQYYTMPLVLRHKNHYTLAAFEIAPIEEDCDIILPYWWLAKHEPQNFWLDNSSTVEFSSPHCKENCTKHKAKEFSLEINNDVTDHPEAMIIGHISSTVTS